MAEKKRKSSRGTEAQRAMKAVVDARARVKHLEQRKLEVAKQYDDRIARAQEKVAAAVKAAEPYQDDIKAALGL